MSLYETALTQIKSAFDKIKNFGEDYFELISYHNRIIEINIPVLMDNGKIKNFVGYRAQHNNAAGPYKGGIRFHQDVSIDELKALSIWMSMKTAVLDLPLGGGKGGIIVNPKELSDSELQKLSRGYVQGLYKYLGPNADVPAPDVNTNGQIMAWMSDEYNKLSGTYNPGAFTGKPLGIGGSLVREVATGLGGYYVLEKFMELEGKNLKDMEIIIHGAGNVGLGIAVSLYENGYKITGISDSRGGIMNKSGINIGKIVKIKKNGGYVGDDDTEGNVKYDDILTAKCDILIPSALENQINTDNVDHIKASYILELANGPVTQEADKMLFDKGIKIIPDILANAGGVTVSYFEQVQNNTNFYWSEKDIKQKLKDKMDKASMKVYNTSKDYNVDFRTGAYIIAIEKIVNAIKLKN